MPGKDCATFGSVQITSAYLHTETFALSALVNFFDNHKDYTSVPTGVESGSLLISYKSMQQDVRRAMDWIHVEVMLLGLYTVTMETQYGCV